MQGNRVPVLRKLPAYELNTAIDCQPSNSFYNRWPVALFKQKWIFLQIWLTFLFAFISVKHNKLQMIHGSYHIRQESSAKQSLSPEGQRLQREQFDAAVSCVTNTK